MTLSLVPWPQPRTVQCEQRRRRYTLTNSFANFCSFAWFRNEFHTQLLQASVWFSYFIRIIFISHVYRGSNEKIVCRWSWVDKHEIFSVVYCSAMFVRRRRVRHLPYRFRWDGRSRRGERWRSFSICFNRRRDDTRKTVTDYGSVFDFISSTIRYAKYIYMKDESCLLAPRRFSKRWWG
jgi:hypothetical protein